MLGALNGFAQTSNIFESGGFVGIGTNTPKYRLDVNGIIKWGEASQFLYSGQDGNGVFFEQLGKVDKLDKLRLQTSINGDETNYSQFIVDPKKGFSFIALKGGSDHVGIGMAPSSTEKLSVKGKIRSEEIKVEVIVWPDYVFEDDYKIISLESLEKFIKINKHLPEVPSAKEITENGLELGEMNKVLMKKVEELTLYLIEQNKSLLDQKAQIMNQQKLLEKQQQDIDNLKRRN
ncbi:hypothetical protein B0A66_03320 [Flavobacterium hercynium]|uniref:Peptidase S74 domain-containing protein n=2 Tax=Flavobacterium hercynium TaxID=387094 RepID=A0A226HKJ3_9FLAO|nr:hypothetical protein B0A66_03320 [Flavobacterium hercynium]